MNSRVLIQKSLVICIVLFALTGCNEQEFYEKEFLEGAGVPDEQILPDINPDSPISDDSIVDDADDDSVGGVITTPTTPDDSDDADNGNTDGGDTDSGNTDGGDTDGGNTDGGDTDGGNTDGGDTDGGDTDGGNNGGGGSTDEPDDEDEVVVEPGLCGDGTLTNASDQFIQNTAQEAKVDILWVMDNSGSMSDEQQALSNNFDAFISDFIQKNIDFKMAITTTDGRRNSGQMVGDSDELTSVAAANNVNRFMNNFTDQINVGIRGSGDEMGIETSKDFFDNYRSWAREDAYLIVVYISDEEDNSRGFVSDYISNLQSLKASAGMVKAYSIVTTELDPNKQWESVGERYMQVSRATGGEIASIHQDFHETLSGFGFKILDLLDSFPLSGVPVGTELSVTVNNQVIEQGWTYDEASRSIKFDENAIPDEGEVIIAYYQKCVME